MPGDIIDDLMQPPKNAKGGPGKPASPGRRAAAASLLPATMIASTEECDRVWAMVGELKTCMLTTWSAGGMRARPMHALPDRNAGCIYFITDRHGAKEEEIRTASDVCLAFAETGSNTYLSMTGRADMTHEIAKIRELWNAEAQAWWPKGPDDPDVRLLRVIPESAEYWDGRGNAIVVAFKLTMARVTGSPPDFDESHKVRLPTGEPEGEATVSGTNQ